MSGDPYFNNVSLLLHMDGDNGSTTFTDSSSNSITVTPSGNTQISTAQNKFGGASGYFDGTGDYLTAANNSVFALGSSDFTIEMWVYITSYGGGYTDFGGALVDFREGIYSAGFLFILTTSGALRLWANQSIISTSTGSVSLNAWTHIALARSSSTAKFFIGGSGAGSFSLPGDYTDEAIAIGTVSDSKVNDGYLKYNGYIDDLRITKGVARYTSDFTPPTEAFPDTVSDPTAAGVVIPHVSNRAAFINNRIHYQRL